MSSDFLKQVGERIRSLRKEKGLTQEALAEKASIHYSYISGIKHADRNISLETLEKIIDALNVVPLEVFQFHALDVNEQRTDRTVALDALNSLLVERNTNEILTVLRVAKEILVAVDTAKHK
nr:helix-turn-helix domain-containing protein [Cohnella abietis]